MSSSYASAADRFVAVAKVLTDQRVNELQEEIRKLQLENFWLKYNYTDLCEAMTFVNQKFSGPNCQCLACMEASRFDTDEPMTWRGA